jgi:hypothetical protein
MCAKQRNTTLALIPKGFYSVTKNLPQACDHIKTIECKKGG